MDKKEDVIIYQRYGGLGDNLQFSTLPELYSSFGHDIYIHSDNAVRNEGIDDLVWKKNPFIKGRKNLPVNAGEFPWVQNQHINPLTNTFIEIMEMRHGLPPTNIYPKIYYNPVLIEDLKDTTLIDFNAVSRLNDRKNKSNILYSQAADLIEEKDLKNVKILEYSSLSNPHENMWESTPRLKVDNIFHLCDILYSCQTFICSHSGNHSLVSAIKADRKTPQVFCFPNHWPVHDSHLHIFPNIDYIQIKS